MKKKYNKVRLTGVIGTDFIYDHEAYNEKFYSFLLKAERPSKAIDTIPVLISERLYDMATDLTNQSVKIKGEVRSKSIYGKLNVYVFAMSFELAEDGEHENELELVGTIGRNTPVLRKSSLNKLDISDFRLPVCRNNGSTGKDYIPCITWGRNAILSDALTTGTTIRVFGRFQSRIYKKEEETRTAYEMSIYNMEIIEEEK